MEVVDEWTGRHAMALRRALRLTLDGFAERLGTAVRTAAKWSAEPELVPSAELQRALDTLLYQSPDAVKTRFALLLTAEPVTDTAGTEAVQPPTPGELRLTTDQNIAAGLAWLDRAAGWSPGTARTQVARQLDATDPRALQDRGHRRAQVRRDAIGDALAEYYDAGTDNVLYRASTGAGSLNTTVLTRRAWLDLALPLGTDREDFRFSPVEPPAPVLEPSAADAAVHRLADALALDLRLVNAPLYRLTNLDVGHRHIRGTVARTDFVSYALTMDLLENELVDAIATGRPVSPGTLPLRDQHLPDVDAVLNVGSRLCAGGPLALTAIARPGGRRRSGGDYLLLVQERSGRVLNAARRLAVIPKAFHEPLVDYSDDACISATLEREMEEELFGRTDVDSVLGASRHADPMHPSRVSEPMRWLLDHADGGHWRMECTGFGFNLVSGNYEFPSLLVIDDEEWLERFGGHVEANWESDNLRRYSTRDREHLAALAHDPAWSNEGLFALLQGFRRLNELGGDRVNLPDVEWEF